MNDSPTDGVTRTIDLVTAPARLRSMGYSNGILRSPDISVMKGIIGNLCEPGTGIFTSRLMRELDRRGLQVKITGFDPWANRRQECLRVAQDLGLQAGPGNTYGGDRHG
jgi:hypothetical protein